MEIFEIVKNNKVMKRCNWSGGEEFIVHTEECSGWCNSFGGGWNYYSKITISKY